MDAQAGLRLCCSQTSKDRFSHVAAHISHGQISLSANEDSCSIKVHIREDSGKCKYKNIMDLLDCIVSNWKECSINPFLHEYSC